jgi:hypothetical protein
VTDTDCDDRERTPTAGTENFVLTPNKYMYLNGYEILITAPNEGLLYLPLIKTRIPVEWNRGGMEAITNVKKATDGDYGCVFNGEARMQGSVTGAIGRDLHRQVMALLTQGAGSFSGKFGEALENLKIKATELKTKSGITQTDWTTLNSYIVASKSGFTEWKGSISNAFGNDIPEEVQTALTRLGEIEEELAQLSACATENIPQGGGGDNYLNFTAMLRLACAMQFDKLIAKQGEAGELALFLEEVLDPESIWGVPSGTVSYGRCFFDENKVTADIARKFPDNGSLKEGFRIRVRGKTLLPGAIEAVPCYEMRYWYDGEPGTRNNRGFYASEAYGEKVLTYHRALVFLANTEVLKCPQHLRANYQSSQAQIWDSFTGSRTFSNDGDYFAEAISDFSDDHIRFWQSRLDCIGISPSYIEYEVGV